ncbi:tyrosine-type recombinase/integrase [Streptomyces subrutilus]|uniref:tyrosine-type recombinase/integrase n=1 Tax=Streptomyces subrutilus TaxID=36818 RepID=UPI000B2B48AE|nr:tyrosine-type recombinase/integrase [Streptomyces subrutilus]
MSVDAPDEKIIDAELVEDDLLPSRAAPASRPLVDLHTVLRPGQPIPTTADRGPVYAERDIRLSDATARALEEAEEDSGTRKDAVRRFERWCAERERVAHPCTTATFTEYGRHLMDQGLKVSTIKNYMSLIRTHQPVGKQPDNSLYLQLLRKYRAKSKRASRKKQAFPITLPYLIPMMAKAEKDGRPIGIRDAAMLAFGYRFLARSSEQVDLDIEDLTILDDRIVVWLAKDKTHQDEDQTIILHDREDLQLVARMRRWLAHLATHQITTGPLFRHLHPGGRPATGFRTDIATKRGDYLRAQTVNDRVKLWFRAAGLVTDGRPVSSQGLRAGGATDLAEAEATDEEIQDAGRWKKGSPIPRAVYVRPAQAARKDPFSKVPIHGSPSGELVPDQSEQQATG